MCFRPTTLTKQKTIINLDKLRTDQEFEEMLVRGNRLQLALTEWWRSTLTNAEAMCSDLARFSNRHCAVTDASN